MKKYSSAPDASLAGINECFCFHLFKELKLHLYFIECICMFPKPTAWFLQNSGTFDWVTAVLFFSQGEKKGMKWNPQETAVDRTKWTSYSLTQKRERKIIILLCYLPACVAWARTQINQSAYPGMFSYLLWGQIMEMKKTNSKPYILELRTIRWGSHCWQWGVRFPRRNCSHCIWNMHSTLPTEQPTFSLGFTYPTTFHLRFLRGASTKGKVTGYTFIPI